MDRYSVEAPEGSEDGVVAIEYVVVAAAIVVGLLTIFGDFGSALVTRLNEIMEFGVMMTPGLAVDGEVKSVGKIPRKEDVLEWIR